MFLKKSMGWYLAWVLLHLGLLLIGSDGIFDGGNMGQDIFGHSAEVFMRVGIGELLKLNIMTLQNFWFILYFL